jgi:hypothetical protein
VLIFFFFFQLQVTRTYEAVDDPADLCKDEQTGIWIIKIKSRIRVKLELTNTIRNFHVALVDKLPAGLEVRLLEQEKYHDMVDCCLSAGTECICERTSLR